MYRVSYMDNEKLSGRSRARVRFAAHALVRTGYKGIAKGVVRDISIDSIYLLCNSPFELGDEARIEIVLIGEASELIVKVAAKVNRIDEDGIALKFNKPMEWWPIFSQLSIHQLKR